MAQLLTIAQSCFWSNPTNSKTMFLYHVCLVRRREYPPPLAYSIALNAHFLNSSIRRNLLPFISDALPLIFILLPLSDAITLHILSFSHLIPFTSLPFPPSTNHTHLGQNDLLRSYYQILWGPQNLLREKILDLKCQKSQVWIIVKTYCFIEL
jgi:hypothetical protein